MGRMGLGADGRKESQLSIYSSASRDCFCCSMHCICTEQTVYIKDAEQRYKSTRAPQ